jgi:hypothetical protein
MFKVGDRVWWDHVNSGQFMPGRETVVTKVGRKYFEVACDKGSKFDLQTGRVHDAYGYYWVDPLQVHNEKLEVMKAREELRRFGLDPSWRMNRDALLAAYEALKPVIEATKRGTP